MTNKRPANWGCGGVMFLLTSIIIPVIYLVTGGLPAKGGRILKGENAGTCAFLMSAVFFLIGILSIGVSILKRLKEKPPGNNSPRWRG